MPAVAETLDTVRAAADAGYKYGFETDIAMDLAPKGLNEDIIRLISARKDEPGWLLEWRLKSFRAWLSMAEPSWAAVKYAPIDFQDLHYYAAPRRPALKSMDEVDPELLRTFEKLGVPLSERAALAGVAVDAVFDSVSVATTFKDKLTEKGIIFCPISEAVREHPEIVQKYLGSVVPAGDNFYAALNSAVFTDGVELVALDEASIKYSTVQNWYPGDAQGKGGIYNFVTKRGACRGARSKISWTQVETGSAITWKYPSCILQGEGSVGEFYSVAMTNHFQQADTGTKMIHLAPNTRSTIVSKGISAGRSQNTYRGLVRMMPRAQNARNHTQCDSLLIGDRCGAHTVPYIESRCPTAKIEHEATTSRIAEDQLFYCRSRGLSAEDSVGLIVNGFCKEVLAELPMEFAVEAQKLLAISLEGSVG
jgi:Fe-S cluster assembly protein SufB